MPDDPPADFAVYWLTKFCAWPDHLIVDALQLVFNQSAEIPPHIAALVAAAVSHSPHLADQIRELAHVKRPD